jgi:hypothetical protein
MTEYAGTADQALDYPVRVDVTPVTEERNRLTTAFRFFLAIPHLLLVGGPAAVGGWMILNIPDGWSWGSSSGLIGIVAGLATLVAWFVIVITARHPTDLWKLAAYYLRWRVRAIAYMTLLRDEYPPFGDDEYPAALVVAEPTEPRDRLTVFFRLILALPHLLLLAVISFFWALATAVAWILILITGRYPETLYGFALGALAWSARVEAYMLLLTDAYPPFTLRA